MGRIDNYAASFKANSALVNVKTTVQTAQNSAFPLKAGYGNSRSEKQVDLYYRDAF